MMASVANSLTTKRDLFRPLAQKMVETATLTNLDLLVLAGRHGGALSADTIVQSIEDECSSDEIPVRDPDKKSKQARKAEATLLKAVELAGEENDALLCDLNIHAIRPYLRTSTSQSLTDLCKEKKLNLGATTTQLLDMVEMLAHEKADDGRSLWKHFRLCVLMKEANKADKQDEHLTAGVEELIFDKLRNWLFNEIDDASISGLGNVDASALPKEAAKTDKEALEALAAGLPDGASITIGPFSFHKNWTKATEPPVVQNFHSGSVVNYYQNHAGSNHVYMNGVEVGKEGSKP